MTYKELAEQEAKKHNLFWCRGVCGKEGHKRGFVSWKEPIIHLDSEIATRSTLHRFFHELGHAILNHDAKRSYIREAEAERFASDKLREYGIPVPRKCVALGRDYVARKKRHGDRIKAGRV